MIKLCNLLSVNIVVVNIWSDAAAPLIQNSKVTLTQTEICAIFYCFSSFITDNIFMSSVSILSVAVSLSVGFTHGEWEPKQRQ